MNGNFEQNKTVYPIAYLLNGRASLDGPTYDIVDMRTLYVVLRTEYTAKQLEAVVHTLNDNLRAGKYEAEGAVTLAEDAAYLLGEATKPAPMTDAVAQEATPEVEQVGQRTQQVRAPQSLAFTQPLEPLEKL